MSAEDLDRASPLVVVMHARLQKDGSKVVISAAGQGSNARGVQEQDAGVQRQVGPDRVAAGSINSGDHAFEERRPDGSHLVARPPRAQRNGAGEVGGQGGIAVQSTNDCFVGGWGSRIELVASERRDHAADLILEQIVESWTRCGVGHELFDLGQELVAHLATSVRPVEDTTSTLVTRDGLRSPLLDSVHDELLERNAVTEGQGRPGVFLSVAEGRKISLARPFRDLLRPSVEGYIVSDLPLIGETNTPEEKVDAYLERSQAVIVFATSDLDAGRFTRPNIADEIARARSKPHLRNRICVLKQSGVTLASNTNPAYNQLDPDDPEPAFAAALEQLKAWGSGS